MRKRKHQVNTDVAATELICAFCDTGFAAEKRGVRIRRKKTETRDPFGVFLALIVDVECKKAGLKIDDARIAEKLAVLSDD